MEKLINSMLASADSLAFREPVDWRGLGLTDYPAIIKRPMDLGTIKLQLQQGAYGTSEEVAADVRLIWDNCRTYNCGGIPRKLHRSADILEKRFEARFAKLPAGGGLKQLKRMGGASGGRRRSKGSKSSSADLTAAPSSDERRRLARYLSRAPMEDVTKAIHEIDRWYPDALILKDDGSGGTIDVDIDALDTWTFCAVERVVAPQAAQRRASRGTTRRASRKKRPAAVAAVAKKPAGAEACSSSSTHLHGALDGIDAEEGDVPGTAVAAAEKIERPCKKAKVEDGAVV